MCCRSVSLDQRSSPFGLSGYDSTADELSVSGCLGHSGPPGGLAIGPPSLQSAGPPTSVQWKPAVAVAQHESSLAVSCGQDSALDVSRLTANMQVSSAVLTNAE